MVTPLPFKEEYIYHVYILTYIIYNSTHEKLIFFFLPYQMPYLYVAKQIWIMHKKNKEKPLIYTKISHRKKTYERRRKHIIERW